MPNAKEPKELEKLLGLYELSPIYPSSLSSQALSSSASNYSSSSIKDMSKVDSNKDNSSISSGTNSSCTSTQSQSSQSQSDKDKQKGQDSIKFQEYPPLKLWHIQPACAITGEGLQEGLEALYDMIVRKRKIHKNKKKR